MKIPKVKGQPVRSTIIYSTRVTLSNIPEEAYRYQLGARSAIEWIIDLLKRIVTVSLETMKIVDAESVLTHGHPARDLPAETVR